MQPPLLCVIDGSPAEWRYYVDHRPTTWIAGIPRCPQPESSRRSRDVVSVAAGSSCGRWRGPCCGGARVGGGSGGDGAPGAPPVAVPGPARRRGWPAAAGPSMPAPGDPADECKAPGVAAGYVSAPPAAAPTYAL